MKIYDETVKMKLYVIECDNDTEHSIIAAVVDSCITHNKYFRRLVKLGLIVINDNACTYDKSFDIHIGIDMSLHSSVIEHLDNRIKEIMTEATFVMKKVKD